MESMLQILHQFDPGERTMKVQAFDTLDKERLKSLIESLQFALQFGFNSLSSPTRPLLEAAIDLSLLIGEKLLQEEPGEKLNQDLKFLDLDKPDPLGNSKSVRVGPQRSLAYNSEALGHFLKEVVAPFFVDIVSRKSEAQIFHGFEARFRKLRPNPQNSEDFSKNVPIQHRLNQISPMPDKAKKMKGYFRRRLRK